MNYNKEAKMNETIDKMNDALSNLEMIILKADLKHHLMDDDSEGARLLKLVQGKLVEISEERTRL